MGARGYGVDLRERIVLAVREGMAVEEAAQQYWVHLQTIQRYLHLDDQGLLGVYVKPSGRPCTLHADATLVEHAGRRPQVIKRGLLGQNGPPSGACPQPRCSDQDRRPFCPRSEHARNRDGPESELQDGKPGVHATENHP